MGTGARLQPMSQGAAFPSRSRSADRRGKPMNAKMSGLFLLLFNSLCYHIRRCLKQYIGLWLSLVERCVRDAEAAGSNPVNPTIELKGMYFR